MKNMIWKNCRVTNSNATVSKLWKISNTEIHTGVDIVTHRVYSMCTGTVVNVSKLDSGKYAVTVQHDANRCIRYSNLNSIDIELGTKIEGGHLIGTVDKSVHFEYATTDKPNHKLFPVRFGRCTFYKIDPIDLISGRLGLAYKSRSCPANYTDSMAEEFNNSRGDSVV